MIISASKRTDIPAFFSEWFIQCLKNQKLGVRNPYNQQVFERQVTPDNTDCIVFWTKNALTMLDKLNELDAMGYAYYFQYTLNAYDSDIEPNLPKLENKLDTFKKLANKIGKTKVIWRYDPIIFTDKYTPDWHINAFAKLFQELAGYTNKCVISFVDKYGKIESKLRTLCQFDLPDDKLKAFAKALKQIADKYAMQIATCAEAIDLSDIGITKNACIDADLIRQITGKPLYTNPDTSRPECLCSKAFDVGKYDTCSHACVYCYANNTQAKVKANLAKYKKESYILCD